MAEPIGLTASIVGLVGASAKLSLSFYQLADTIISSKEDISTLAAEISVFSQCLSMFSRAIDRSVSNTEGFKEIAEKLVECSRCVIINLAKVVQNISPRWLSDDPERTLNLTGHLKWLFQKSKVMALRRSIESLKMTLLTLISVEDYTESRLKDAPKVIQDSLRLQAKCLLRTSEAFESRFATVESSPDLPLVKSVSKVDETFTQDSSTAEKSTSDIITLSDSDITFEADVEVLSGLEEAIVPTSQLIRTLTIESEADINILPPISASECMDLVLTFGSAALLTPNSHQHWNWSSMEIQKEPKIEQVIYFVDDFEREFTFPLSEVKTWEGMDALIQQVMKDTPLIGDLVEKKRYDVRGPDGRCIVPQLWEVLVKPGITVTLTTLISIGDSTELSIYKKQFKRGGH